MKKFIIMALVCLNLALVAAVVFDATAPSAQAQPRGRGGNYTMITAQDGIDTDALYVIDVNSRRMVAFSLDQTTKQLNAHLGRELDRDFLEGR